MLQVLDRAMRGARKCAGPRKAGRLEVLGEDVQVLDRAMRGARRRAGPRKAGRLQVLGEDVLDACKC